MRPSHIWARAARCPLRRRRPPLRQPARPNRPTGGAPHGPGDVFGASIFRNRWADELWSQSRGCVASGRRLHRPHPQRGQTGRPAGRAVNQVRTGHQCRDRQNAWPHCARQTARRRRRGDRVKRREFITLLGGAAAALPLAARAQQAEKLPTIGFLGASPSIESQRVAAFVQRLRELAWVDGRNLAIEYRWAEGSTERFVEITTEFVRRKVDVIVTVTTPATLAAKQATAVIPIVFAVVSDPVGTGLVASLARPGGNITGLVNQASDIAGKRLDL